MKRLTLLQSTRRAFCRLRVAACAFVTLAACPMAHADIVVPSSATVNASASTVDMGCTDLVVGGAFNLGRGSLVNVRDVVIQTGGSISAATASIAVARNWSNLGNFEAGTGSVSFADNPGCATASAISGNTVFNNLKLTSLSGRTITLAAGATQTVTGTLTVTGTAALPVQVLSSGTTLSAINLVSPSQVIGNVAVNNVAATGQWLAAGQINRNPNGFAPNWFGDGLIVPTLSVAGLLLLSTFMTLLAFFSGAITRQFHLGRGTK